MLGCVIISSYKGHTIFAIILSLIIFQNPLAISLAVIGANLPDFDHKIKNMYVIAICLTGILISVFLYHFNFPFYLGIVILALGLVFLISSHRGFTHSFFGIIIQSVSIGLILFLGSKLLLSFGFLKGRMITVCIIILFMGVLFLNKKVFILILFLITITIWKFSTFNINFINLAFPIILGLLSHMILDSFTPSGVKPFIPFSNKKFYKLFGISMLIILAIIFALFYTKNFDKILNFISSIFYLPLYHIFYSIFS